jgi:hypothetical protein
VVALLSELAVRHGVVAATQAENCADLPLELEAGLVTGIARTHVRPTRCRQPVAEAASVGPSRVVASAVLTK